MDEINDAEKSFNVSLFEALDYIDGLEFDTESNVDGGDKKKEELNCEQSSAIEMYEKFRTDLDSSSREPMCNFENCSRDDQDSSDFTLSSLNDSKLDEDGIISGITTQMSKESNDIKRMLEVELGDVEIMAGDRSGRSLARQDEMEDGLPVDSKDRPALDRKLNNRQTVFQAVYLYHRSIGGNVDSVFKMKQVENMFPEIVRLLKSGHGLIPGALARRKLVTHVEKGSGKYRMTDIGIAEALKMGW